MWLIALVLAYLIGSIPTAYVVGRYIYKIDIRRRGSGNVGATNALRTMGTVPGAVVLIVDIFKGIVAVWIGLAAGGQEFAALSALAAIAGHNWSVFLNFKGGRGVATAAGAALAMAPGVLLWGVVIWVTVIFLTRFVSLGSIVAAVAVPVMMFAFSKPWPYVVFSIVGATIIIYRHKVNIKRLLAGVEPKIGERG